MGALTRPSNQETMMEATLDSTALPGGSTAARWSGRVLTGIPVAFMLFDAAIKFAHIPEVAEASLQLGWPTPLNPVLGVIILGCLALYLWPRTAALGATLFTGYLGGAVAIHLRVGDPLASHVLFPVYVGVLFWAGLALRDARVRALVLPK
ncbi:MAG TPA: DoxX family protein [Myxococcaceae bacterium]|nr:DoxX family protein [Myxococcaceae bacterium]